MMISCDEASLICNKTQYKEASFWEVAKLRLHLFICKTCPQFTKKNTKLTSLCNKANLAALSKDDKDLMKDSLQEKI